MEKLAQLTVELNLYHNNNAGMGLFNNANKEIFTGKDLKDACDVLIYILGHEKPTGDLGPARDDTEGEDVYYKEREWRIIPTKLAEKSFNKNKNKIPINREDIRVIVVPSIDIKKEVVKFLQNYETFKDDLPAILIYDELKYF